MLKSKELTLKLNEAKALLEAKEDKLAKLLKTEFKNDADLVDPVKDSIETMKLNIAKIEGEIKDAEAYEAMSNVDWAKHESGVIRNAYAATMRVHSETTFKTRKNVNFTLRNAISSTEKDRVAVLLWGPTGTGKTTAVKWMGGELNRPVISQNFSSGLEESDILGGPNVAADGSLRSMEGPLTEAVRNGCIYVAEEMNFAKPGVSAILNSLLDGNQQIVLSTGEIVKAAPGFKFVGTINPHYAGTRDFNKALVNRFGLTIEFNRPTNKMLTDIVKSVTSYGTKSLDEYINLSKLIILMGTIEKLIKKDNLDAAISVRQLIATVRFLQDGETFNNSVDYGMKAQVSNFDEDLGNKIMGLSNKLSAQSASDLGISTNNWEESVAGVE